MTGEELTSVREMADQSLEAFAALLELPEADLVEMEADRQPVPAGVAERVYEVADAAVRADGWP